MHERTIAILPRYATTLAAARELLTAAAAHGSPVARQEAVRLWMRAQTLVLAGYQGIELAENGDPAPAASLIQRLQWGLLNQRIFELASDIGGPEALDPGLPFAHLLLASRGYACSWGTSAHSCARRPLDLRAECS